jgi:hypothetical protein
MTDDLTKIGMKAGTDKATWHNYTKYYHEILKGFRKKEIFFLELGFGGYEWSDAGGESVKMWSEYAPSWDIAVVDLHDKDSDLVPEGVTFYQGSQNDAGLLDSICEVHGRPTIIVDDASHVSGLTIHSFNVLWPELMPGGWYIVEDIGTSYVHSYGGNDSGGPGTAVHELGKSMIDSIMANSNFGRDQNILSLQPDLSIDVMHVMPNAIGLRKKL